MSSQIDRALGVSVIKTLLNDLKVFKNSIKHSADELAVLLKRSAKTGIGVVDDILLKIKVQKTARGFLAIEGDVPINKFEHLIKSADLDGLTKITKTTKTVTSKEKTAFKEIVGKTAESELHNLNELTQTAAQSSKYADLNIHKITESTPKTTLEKIKIAEKALLAIGKTGAVISLTVGVIYIVANGLSRATSDRTGCFMLTTINGKVESCKVSRLTCSSEYASSGVKCPNNSQDINVKLNVLLCLLSLENVNEKTKIYRDKVCELSGVSQDSYISKFNEILNSAKFQEIFTYIMANIDGISAGNNKPICELSAVADTNGKVPLCRMCDPGASPLSTEFVDTNSLADNITFECRNPTILDTIVDVAKSTGLDLLKSITTPVWQFLKPFAIVASVFAVLAFIIGLVFKLINKAKMNNIKFNFPENTKNINNQFPNTYTRFI